MTQPERQNASAEPRDANPGIETLTDDERRACEERSVHDAQSKALRIIDQLTAEQARLVRQSADNFAAKNATEAECERLRQVNRELLSTRAEAESRLAAANALLERLNKRGGLGLDVHDMLEAHLAEQAAPVDEGYEGLPAYYRPTVARTEAEQRVLDACITLHEGCEADEPESEAVARVMKATAAMLRARRGLKP